MEFEIPINANLFNTIEYVLFDLVLAFGVYVLTSKLVGLYNCYDALKNQRKSSIRDDMRAPLFDLGIVCTKQHVFRGIVAIRILSWILIFATNLLIRGRSKNLITLTKATVITRGPFSVFDPPEDLVQRRFRRLACARREGNSTYYGEIRNGTCEMRPELYSHPPIRFGVSFDEMQISTTGCTPENNTDVMMERFECNRTLIASGSTLPIDQAEVRCTYNRTGGDYGPDICYIIGPAPHDPCERKTSRNDTNASFECGKNPLVKTFLCKRIINRKRLFSLCDNAVVSCRGKRCSGLVNVDGVTHMCDKMEVGNQSNLTASCMRAEGVDWNITDWVPFYGNGPVDTIENTVALAYGSGSELRDVKTYVPGKEQAITAVHYLWVATLIIKILMLIVLFITCEVLSRRFGVFVVANDEPRIFSLLSTTVSRIRRGPHARSKIDTHLRVTLDNGDVRLHDDEEEAGG